MKKKLVIFDWAGTTVDYGSFAPVNAFDQAFREFGLEPTIDEIRAPMGLLKKDHIRTILEMPRLREQWIKHYGFEPDSDAVEDIYQVFEKVLMQSLEKFAVPKPDTLKAVRRLREMGLFIGSTTGYTDKMMDVVRRRSAELGYTPDMCFTPDAVDGMGRPYPYMIYENMFYFHISSVEEVVKIGDTVSDIREGKQAGVCSLGVLEGSSIIGLSKEEYDALSGDERENICDKARQKFYAAGADDVLLNLEQLPKWIEDQTATIHFSL